MDVAVAHCAKYPDISGEAAGLAAALARRGVDARVHAWNDPAAPWDEAPACVVRSVWDYPDAVPAFLEWLDRLSTRARVWNDPATIRWNLVKTYLRDLAANGVPTIPTEWVRAGSNATLADVRAARGWDEVVVKPAVDATAMRAMRVPASRLADDEAHLARHAATGDVMVQPFLDGITRGETSLVFVDGAHSHAVRKVPRAGDWRVQGTWGGTAEPATPTREEREVADAALAAVAPTPLVARVDLVPGPKGEPLLIELELIEPVLFLAHAPGSVERLADAVAARVRA